MDFGIFGQKVYDQRLEWIPEHGNIHYFPHVGPLPSPQGRAVFSSFSQEKKLPRVSGERGRVAWMVGNRKGREKIWDDQERRFFMLPHLSSQQ